MIRVKILGISRQFTELEGGIWIVGEAPRCACTNEVELMTDRGETGPSWRCCCKCSMVGPWAETPGKAIKAWQQMPPVTL